MDTRTITTFEIEAVASPIPFAAVHANDWSERLPTPQTAGRALTRWLVDAALCALIAAALYGGMRPDPTAFDRLTRRPGARTSQRRTRTPQVRSSILLSPQAENGAAVVVGRGRKERWFDHRARSRIPVAPMVRFEPA
jgi:hypothetical protein